MRQYTMKELEEIKTRRKELKENYDNLPTSLKSLNVFADNRFLRSGEDLTLYQKRLIALAIAQLKVEDRDLTPEEFHNKRFTISTDYFKNAFSINEDDKNVYSKLKECCKSLMRKPFKLYDKKTDKEIDIAYFDTITYLNKLGKIEIKFGSTISEFLVQLQKNYASYNLYLAYSFKKIHSIKIFEILQTQKVGDEIKMDWDQFKKAMGIFDGTGYKYPTDVKNRILKPVQKEMQDIYNINFEFEIKKNKQCNGNYEVSLKTNKNNKAVMEWLKALSFDNNEKIEEEKKKQIEVVEIKTEEDNEKLPF